MPGPCSEKSSAPPRGEGALRRRRSAISTHGPGGVRCPYFFPLEWQVHPCLILRATSLSLQGDPANIVKGSSRSARCYQGVRGSVWDPEPSREWVGDWGGPETAWAPLCVAERRATNGEWGYSTRRLCWATSAQERCHPQEALYLPTFSHLLIVNSKLLSLSLSLSLGFVVLFEKVLDEGVASTIYRSLS
jgi:hypothetical protein